VITIGGMHYVPGKRKLMDVLAVDDADLAALKELTANGIKVNVQTVPTQRPVPLEKIFTDCKI
jgi:mannose/fructose/N-acetylgalactosamine-specific phosphotransferase system component IIB